ncbi:MAG: DNA gyrase inhibitor YacG [Endozoicomonas sp. (ex Botrylloides leachii)]|nr:DNA gyrase inhibitor YacG [Endozoicomonas sp. (ex Botrylloides leachii)]
MIVKCPHCNKDVKWMRENAYRPFCSQRCKLIDFGSWVNEEHVIAGDNDANDFISEDPEMSLH